MVSIPPSQTFLSSLSLPRQYYCCKKNGSEADVGPGRAGPAEEEADPLSHFPCNACNALAMDGMAINPVSLDQLDSGSHRNQCPTCSPYSHPHSCAQGLPEGMHNGSSGGGERLGFHTYYENPAVALPLASDPQGSSPLSYFGAPDAFPPPPPPPRPYSTQV